MAKQTIPVASYANPSAPTFEELKARVALLERLDNNKGSNVKRTEKGSLSMYGLSSQYPDTKTLTQWIIIDKQMPSLMAFAKANFEHLHFASDEQRAAAKKHLGLE